MKKTPKPLVSVLLPVYNCEEYLEETLNSLSIQTYDNFEIIAINDGSTDGSLAILERYAARDPRCKITSQKNRGLVATLNRAAELASGEFLARIDGDDLALKRRFELQVQELLNHPDAVLCASAFDVMNEDGEILYHDTVPSLNDDILNALYIRNPIAHGSIMMRREAFFLAGQYSADCGPTEDYHLWARMVKLGQVRVLNNSLFRWRVNPVGITSTQSIVMSEYMRMNLDIYWSSRPFQLLSRRELMGRCRYYISSNPLRGVGQKHTILRDLCEISFLLAKKGSFITALRQLIIIASTGRTGLGIVISRIKKYVYFHSTGRLPKSKLQ